MKRNREGALFCFLMAMAVASSFSLSPRVNALPTSDADILLMSYLRLSIAQQIPAQAQAMSEGMSDAVAAQVMSSAKSWMKNKIGQIRGVLESELGDRARKQFEMFVAQFTTAEQAEDADYLTALSSDVGIGDVDSYSALRGAMIENRLKEEVIEGSDFLGEIQTWMDLNEKGDGVPPLHIWITRKEQPARSPASSGVSSEGAVDPLEAAEAEWGEVDLDEVEAANPMEAFDSNRKAEKERKMAEAQAAMQQIAAERQAAEEEYAQKNLAAAQKEAEAMRKHAEELAAVEQQALEQRQRSWGNRLKAIVGTAAGSFGGAFLGGIGERAAEEAIDQVWQTN